MSFDPQKMIRKQEEAKRSQSWFLTKIHDFNQAHNQLKHTVHTAWRYPLPPWGRAVMACVYFSMPVVAGYYISTWAVSKSEATVQNRFGNAESNQIQGLGDKKIVRDEAGEHMEKVGAGGWGGGVNLATSDKVTQEANKVNIERFFKKQRRLQEKRDRELRRKEKEGSTQ